MEKLPASGNPLEIVRVRKAGDINTHDHFDSWMAEKAFDFFNEETGPGN